MDLQQTWAQVQALPIGDQQTILGNLLSTLPPTTWQANSEEELITELARREQEDITTPEGGSTFEEFLVKRSASK